MKIHGFLWKVSNEDTAERFLDVEGVTEEKARERAERLAKKHGFILGDGLGKRSY